MKITPKQSITRASFVILFACLLSAAPRAFAQQQPGSTATTPVTPAPSVNTQQTTTTTPGANTQQSPPPASNARPLTPDAQVQQSAQPATQATEQNRGSQTTPSTTVPSAPAPSTNTTTDTLTPGVTVSPGSTQQQQPLTPGAIVAPPPGVRQPGRESVVTTPAPDALPAVPPIAPDFRADNTLLPELGRVGVDMLEQRPLTLREALEMALANNKDIEVARQNVRLAELDLLGARGVYDLRISSLSYYERSTTPSSSTLSGSTNGSVTQADYTGTARLEGLVPKYGGGYRIDFSSIRLTTNNQFAALNPQFPTALTFNYTQPILRGRTFDINRRQIEVAKKNLTLTDVQFRQRTIETITNVQRGYWDLVFALRNLQIQRDAVRDARVQLEHNKRLVAEGMLAPIDVVAADAQVSGFEQSVYSALEDVTRAENSLKNLIAENRQSALWNAAIIPTDPVELAPPAVSLPDAMSAALTNRPELQQSDLAREINELDQRLYRAQKKPVLDVVATYGVVGLAGSLDTNSQSRSPFSGANSQLTERVNTLSQLNGLPPLPILPPQTFPDELIGGYGQSLSNLLANRYNNFRLGVQLVLPLRSRTAEAQLGRSLVEGQRLATQREQLEQLIQVDVRNALQVVRTSQSRLRAAALARNASEQQFESEQRKFDAGQSTLFLVLERQTALTTARGNELRAQTDLNKAIAELQRATGNALEANNVVVRVR